MNEIPESQVDFLQALLAQEQLLQTPEFEAGRLKLLTRLAQARRRERIARWITLAVLVVAVAVFCLLSAVNLNWIGEPALWPEWLKTAAAGCMLLFPLAALLLTALYLFRHRLELHRARELVQQAAFAEVLRRVQELTGNQPGLRDAPSSSAPAPNPAARKA